MSCIFDFVVRFRRKVITFSLEEGKFGRESLDVLFVSAQESFLCHGANGGGCTSHRPLASSLLRSVKQNDVFFVTTLTWPKLGVWCVCARVFFFNCLICVCV